MKRKLLLVAIASILIFLIVVGLVAFLKLYSPNLLSPPPKVEAKITVFTLDNSWGSPLAGLTMYSCFDLTVENSGNTDVNGLYLTVKSFNESQNYEFEYYNMNFTLHASEVANIKVGMFTSFDVHNNLSNQNFLATLTANGIILDECSLRPSDVTNSPTISATGFKANENQNLPLLVVIVIALVSVLCFYCLLLRKGIKKVNK